MRVLGIIPARGGSRRCPRKNIADLGGRPLIDWTIQAAIDSDVFTALLVSTEDKEISQVAERCGCSVWDRPPHLARDDTPSLDVVTDVVLAHGVGHFDVVHLLQPTSPFRTADDIAEAHGMLSRSGGDAVVSVSDLPQDVFEVGHAWRMRPRSDFVVPNGAIYAITGDALSRGEDWYSGVTYAYKMPRERSLDIDTPLDLEVARLMVERGLVAA